jgi:DNA mismatch repair protein MutS
MYQIYNVTEIVATGEQEFIKNRVGFRGHIHCIPNSSESEFVREEYFRRMFKVKSLMPVKTLLGIHSEAVEKGLLYLLRFVEDHFPQQAERLISHTMYNPQEFMRLSNNILEQLNIITQGQKSILSIVDTTHSAIGKRAMRERILRPITDSNELQERWTQVEWAITMDIDKKRLIERDLKALYDIPRLHFKIASSTVNATDILQLFQSYGATMCLIQNLQGTPLACDTGVALQISEFKARFSKVFDETKASQRSEGQVIGFFTQTAGPRAFEQESKIQSIQQTWANALQTFCKAANLSPTDFQIEKKTDGYILEANRKLYQTLTATKFTNTTMKLVATMKKSGPLEISCDAFTQYSRDMMYAEAHLEKIIREELGPLCDELWDSLKDIRWTPWLGTVDCTLALANTAIKNSWCKPNISDTLKIKSLRHPLLEIASTRVEYVSHDVSFEKEKGWLIYGVNASGKSSLMKATGIAIILAQAGSFVPATSMDIRPYDAAFSRIWTHDNIWAGLSSFAVEVAELSDILRLSTDKSLVLGDEVCSGTESSSATALVGATLEALDKKGAHFMFATHLHDLLKVPGLFPRPGIAIWHLRVITQPDGKLIYDRSLQPGSGSSTYGLEVAKAMGLPFEMIQRAHEIRRSLEGIATIQDAPKSSYNAQIQRQICENCKHPIIKDLEVHHIKEQAKGGSNKLRNLIVLCETCHDKHHNKEINITPLTQTSEGLERFAYVPATTKEASKPLKSKWDDGQIEIIKQTIQANLTRPPLRICGILQESHSIHITPTQLKKFTVAFTGRP